MAWRGRHSVCVCSERLHENRAGVHVNLVQCGVGVQAGVGAGGVGPAVAGPVDERGRGVVGPAVGDAGVVRSVGLSTAQRVVGGMAHVYVVVDPWAYGGTVARVSGG